MARDRIRNKEVTLGFAPGGAYVADAFMADAKYRVLGRILLWIAYEDWGVAADIAPNFPD